MSFGKLLRLSPYSLKDFENAISHKESNVVLLVESHVVLLLVLIKGDDEYSAAVLEKIQKKAKNFNLELNRIAEIVEVSIKESKKQPGGHKDESEKRGCKLCA
ncbi:hypothetical protein JHK82_028145 [Glycine max]|nr:hypothetical protein JHK85_028809 [Glycine max]KAG5127310.1 hypothetical protein JHK82_028145 [Glycine max]KAG5151924.1 hypothetical protein JHK84_028396 [Glycine max]